MKINKLKLRGAIGIKKGLGLDEIEIDFTKFGPGLIALTGRNGNGKTTIMENLHPYRQMVSRDGSLQSHFCLKDSYRILEYELDGDLYESKILIDAITGGSEAYLFKNGITLNDGKLTTYDAELEKVLGSADLFFNSVFSGQKSKGIAQLKAGERRKLFYELLNLNTYETLCDTAKKELGKAQVELAGLESEIRTLQAQNEGYECTQEKLAEAENNRTDLLNEISFYENAIKSLQEEIRLSELSLVKLQEKQKQNVIVAQDISKKQQEIESLTANHNEAVEKNIYEKRTAINEFDSSNEYKQRIEEKEKSAADLVHEEYEAQQKVTDERDGTFKELTKLENDLQDNKKLLSRAQQLSEKKEQYAAKLEEKKTAEKKSVELQQCKSDKQNELLKLQNDEAKHKEVIISNQTKLNGFTADIKDLNNKLENLKNEDNNLRISFQQDSARVREESQILVAVPCGEVGKGCQFLSRAYELKDKLPGIEANFNSKILEISNSIKEVERNIILKEKERDDIARVIIDSKEEFKIKFTDLIEAVRKEIAVIDSNLKSVKGIIDDLGQTDWEKWNKEAQEADTQKQILTEKISGIENSVAQLQENLKQFDARKQEIAKQYKEKKEAIENEITSLKGQQTRERARIEERYQQKREELKNRLDQDIARITKEVEELKAKIDLSLNDEIGVLEINIKSKKDSLSSQESLLKSKKEELPALDKQIAQLQADIQLKATNEKKIEAKKAELKTKQLEVKDYAFLVKAFDKTGIPVLKLENSGIEITSIANDLLSIFENKFRIVFETTRLKADGKSSKETFDINVVEDDGVCEISNKSGGQQVWLETAIQLAISLVVRQQGRNIQTSFLDEKDGALDLENAYAYIEMLRKAHQMSGVHNTFIITHRPELLDFIPQQISLKDGVLEVVN